VVLAAVACAHAEPSRRGEVSIPPQRAAPIFAVAAPPPIVGGTLAVADEGRLLVASDPVYDRVYVVDVPRWRVRHTVQLERGSEPGRVVVDGGMRFHVALRRAGELVTIDGFRGEVVLRREVCPAPRGVAWDESANDVHVACAGGELSTFGVMEAEPKRRLFLDADLRDVVVKGDGLLVSRFRSAEVLEVDAAGEVRSRRRPEALDLDALMDAQLEAFRAQGREVELVERERPNRVFEPRVAWRMIDDGQGGAIVLHQRAADFPLDMALEGPPRVETNGMYGGGMAALGQRGCRPGIVHAAITGVGEGVTTSAQLPGAVLAVDVGRSPEGKLAVAYAGNAEGEVRVVLHPERVLARETPRCLERGDTMNPSANATLSLRAPVAIAWIDERRFVAQYREPEPGLVLFEPPLFSEGRHLALADGESVFAHVGAQVFHRGTANDIACASCHPEGGDDGHVWNFGALGGIRRTQPLGGGGLMASAPFHWSGDLPTLEALAEEVFTKRMGGAPLRRDEVRSLGEFLERIPPPPVAAARDRSAASRGEELYAEVGCTRCHGGDRLSDNRTHDVGTGAPLQTPTLLGLAARAPYFHDGCASSLEARFEECHTEGHGELAMLDEDARRDLVEYLRTL